MTKENPPFKDVFLIEKMGMFQPVMLGKNSGGVPHQLDQGGWILLCELLGQEDNNLAEALTSRTRKTPVSRLFLLEHPGLNKNNGILGQNLRVF